MSANANPMRRALACCSFGNFEAAMEMKMTLSIPKTISNKVSVAKDAHPSAVAIHVNQSVKAKNLPLRAGCPLGWDWSSNCHR
jgi:hypothetical protein